MIGVQRARDALQAQLRARGQDTAPAAAAVRRQPFPYSTPRRYGDEALSSAGWAADATLDLNAGCLQCGNHVCRPDVCHKGRVGRFGFCRMLFWHWRRFTDKQGTERARREHGQLLQKR